MTPTQSAWHELLEALDQIDRGIRARLEKPAVEDQLREIELALTVSLPPEVHQLYLENNGESQPITVGMLFGMKFLRLEDIIFHWGELAELRTSLIFDFEGEFLDPKMRDFYPSVYHVPLFSDDSGNYLGIDLCPSEEGNAGQVIIFGTDLDHSQVVFSSLAELFTELTRQIAADNYTLEREYGHPWMKLKSKTFSAVGQVLFGGSRF